MSTLRFSSRRVLSRCAFVLFVSLFATSAFAQTTQAWLLVSGNWRESLVSTDPAERDTVVKGGWILNGTGSLQSKAGEGLVALHRLARPAADRTDRLLVTDKAKLAQYIKEGFNDEGVVGFVSKSSKSGGIAVHHFTADDKHLWLFDAKDRATAESNGWKHAGIDFWVWPVAKAPTPAASNAKPAK